MNVLGFPSSTPSHTSARKKTLVGKSLACLCKTLFSSWIVIERPIPVVIWDYFGLSESTLPKI